MTRKSALLLVGAGLIVGGLAGLLGLPWLDPKVAQRAGLVLLGVAVAVDPVAGWWRARTARRAQGAHPAMGGRAVPRRRHRLGRRPPYHANVPQRTEECAVCYAERPVGDLHEVAIIEPDTEFGTGGGTSVSASFCPEHCPGGCTRERTVA